MLERFKEYVSISQFNAMRIGLASPDKIRNLSYGEVKKTETINYRTLKPERDGLLCARIFGPVKDWECNCGKYKRMKHRGITCEKCGVEVIQARVRRERMGHINLVAPVCHIWYLKGIPSYLGLIIDMPVKDIERVVYYDAYIVIHQGRSPYPRKTLLGGVEYEKYIDSNPADMEFKADTGAEAVKVLLSLIDLKAEVDVLEDEYRRTASVAARLKIMRRIRVLSGLLHANLRPEWMVIEVLPVLPPDLRPLVPLEGGRFASSDLNELYRRVLNRNIRLQRLFEIEAPAVIIKNEKRMLQESVDALIDNGRRGQPIRGTNRRPLKSLSEMLRGKQGRFRQNLLGRRVDYSARSVIVVDPELRMDQCGIPKIMALELFKPYVYGGLIEREVAPNLRIAKKMVEELDPEIWGVLEAVVHGHPVLLNRAPTLHRLGIQAFYPSLVDGKAIKIHPLVCAAFNADFDGDQMAVHLPLSRMAQEEAKRLMLSVNNVLAPANGKPICVPSQDMVLGLHYLTKVRSGAKGEGISFSDVQEVVSAFQHGSVDLHAKINVRFVDQVVQTTVGRVLLYEALPEGSDFYWVNKIIKKADLAKLVEKVYYRFGSKSAVQCLDKIKKMGFYYATVGGLSFSVDDLLIPATKELMIEKADKEVKKVEKQYLEGVITNGERYNKILSIWWNTSNEVARCMYSDLELQDKKTFMNEDRSNLPFNPVFMILESGARGSKEQIRQLSGMRGLMAKPTGEVMETPVKNNFKDGLTVFEYFVSTHGARKGQADTALKTANSGYLTRRLVDVAQDVVISMFDCQTLGYINIEALRDSGDVLYPLATRVFGRVAATDIKDSVTGQVIVKQGQVITKQDVERLEDAAVDTIKVRSVLTCHAKRGVCAQCYGYDLSKGGLADIGTAVGIIAAQSIGEPGTQLTMKTFHVGGTASGIASQPYFTAKSEGIVAWRGIRTIKNRHGQNVIVSRKGRLIVFSRDERELQSHDLEYGSIIYVDDRQEVKIGTKLVEWDSDSRVLCTEKAGIVNYVDLVENSTVQERFDETTGKSSSIVLEHKGDKFQPAIAIVDKDGNEQALYHLPAGSYLFAHDKQELEVGDVLVKIPRELSRTRDITGGLPRIAELFEARIPKDPAIISDIEGEVVFGGIHRGMRKISVVSPAETFDYLIAPGKQLNVANGDKVNPGDQLTVGVPVMHDVLRILGPDVVQRFLVDQIQEIYRLQGIDINDRHIELIARQMLRKVRIVDAGDTDFLVGDKVDRIHFKTVNSLMQAERKRVAVAKPILMGITQASLGTESFISAASFQETTRILSEAAVSGQIDHLYGLKENVIVGKLIPTGTGISSYRQKYVGDSLTDLERQAQQEESKTINIG